MIDNEGTDATPRPAAGAPLDRAYLAGLAAEGYQLAGELLVEHPDGDPRAIRLLDILHELADTIDEDIAP